MTRDSDVRFSTRSHQLRNFASVSFSPAVFLRRNCGSTRGKCVSTSWEPHFFRLSKTKKQCRICKRKSESFIMITFVLQKCWVSCGFWWVPRSTTFLGQICAPGHILIIFIFIFIHINGSICQFLTTISS